MVSTKLITAADLLAMGSDSPYELIHGELQLVSPSSIEPSMISAFLGGQLDAFLRKTKLGIVTVADGGYRIGVDPDTVVAPDVAVVRRGRIPAKHNYRQYFPGPPDLAVEVVTPADTPSDVLRKLTLYADAGVPLVWIVYPKQRVITVHRLGEPPVTLGETDVVSGDEIIPGFSVAVADVFADPLSD